MNQNVNCLKVLLSRNFQNFSKNFLHEKTAPDSGAAGEIQIKKHPLHYRNGCRISCYAEIEASFLASFAFLFAALFLCRTPLLAAESIAETVSG